MKRRPLIIAAVVTVAALACVVPFWWDAWLWVAYEERAERGAPYYVKTAEWLPGPEFFTESQTCEPCSKLDHTRCFRVWMFIRNDKIIEVTALSKSGRPLDIPAGFDYRNAPASSRGYCTCPTCHPERER